MYNSYVYALYSKLFQLLYVIYIHTQNILHTYTKLLLLPKTNFIIHKYCKFRKLILPGDLEYIFRSSFIYVF